MLLELKTIVCPDCLGRRPYYIVLEDGSVVYCYPPVYDGVPGLISAVSLGSAILAATRQESLDPDSVPHFVLLVGLDARFVGSSGHYHYARVILRYEAGNPYAPLGGFFATTPTPCPEAVLTLCRVWLGEHPIQVTASGGDWELPPST